MLYPKGERAREGGSARASRGCPKGDALAERGLAVGLVLFLQSSVFSLQSAAILFDFGSAII